MARVPLPFRGVAVLLLAASTVFGQTSEPPAELLSLDSVGPVTPDFLRQFSADPRHPLLSLMVDGEMTTFETVAPQEATKLKPTPKTPPAAKKPAAADDCLDEGGVETACPTASDFLPFDCSGSQPCSCRKCLRQRRRCRGHSGCCGQGNPYLNWPTCPAWCFYGAPLEPCSKRCFGRGRCHKHGCGNQGCSWGDDGGGGWGGDGFVDGGCGFGCMSASHCGCFHRRQRCRRQHGCGHDGGWSMGCGGYLAPGYSGESMSSSCGCRKCRRRLRCSSGCGSMDSCCGSGYECGKHRGRRGLFHRCCHQQSYPFGSDSMMMSGMDGGMFGGGYAFGGSGFMGDGFAGDGLAGDGFVADGFVGDGSFEPIVSSTDN